MRGYVGIAFLLLFLLVVGCSSNGEKPEVTSDHGSEKPVVEHTVGAKLELDTLQASDVQEVRLSRSIAFGKVNEAKLAVFSAQPGIDLFINAIHSAKQVEGMLDIRRPDYDVTLLTEVGEHSVHLWLRTEQDGGMYTYVSDTGTGYTLTPEAASSLKQLIMNQSYTAEQAELNGDVVNMHGIQIMNVEKLDKFLTNVHAGTNGHVQLTSYTVEGDPIFSNLNYDGQSIEYTYDTTMDAWGVPSRFSTFCERIDSRLTDEGTEYSLVGCQKKSGDNEVIPWLVIPNHSSGAGQ